MQDYLHRISASAFDKLHRHSSSVRSDRKKYVVTCPSPTLDGRRWERWAAELQRVNTKHRTGSEKYRANLKGHWGCDWSNGVKDRNVFLAPIHGTFVLGVSAI
jgi:hypothetical protein